jgi:hypothetical protein
MLASGYRLGITDGNMGHSVEEVKPPPFFPDGFFQSKGDSANDHDKNFLQIRLKRIQIVDEWRNSRQDCGLIFYLIPFCCDELVKIEPGLTRGHYSEFD